MDLTYVYLFCGLAIILAIIAYVINNLISTYNRLQLISNRVREANSNVLVMVQKKGDLANQLINIAGAYAQHEQLIHINVAQNVNVAAAMAIYENINQTINRVMAIAANFPDLRANQTFQQLMAQLQGIEDELQDKRELYNSIVREYNTIRNGFPFVMYASMLNFQEAPYFADAAEGSLQLRGAIAGGNPLQQLPAQRLSPQLPASSQGQLIGISGEVAGRSFPLGDYFIIGRSASCQLPLSDRAVSRQHARLRFANGRWFIQDMQSSGGTFVNNRRVDAAGLNPGDRIRVGSAELEFRP